MLKGALRLIISYTGWICLDCRTQGRVTRLSREVFRWVQFPYSPCVIGVNILSNNDFHWLVGILEGKGCFYKPLPSSRQRAVITICSTDEDVIKRVSILFGSSYWKQISKNLRHKPKYTTSMSNFRAIKLMTILKPFMSQRRQLKIQEIIDSYVPPLFMRLNQNHVIKIRNEYKKGATSFRKLAKKYHVGKTTIESILKHRGKYA